MFSKKEKDYVIISQYHYYYYRALGIRGHKMLRATIASHKVFNDALSRLKHIDNRL